jgi:hypothetical protein
MPPSPTAMEQRQATRHFVVTKVHHAATAKATSKLAPPLRPVATKATNRA